MTANQLEFAANLLREQLPSIKSITVYGGYVVVIPGDSDRDTGHAVKAAMLALFPLAAPAAAQEPL